MKCQLIAVPALLLAFGASAAAAPAAKPQVQAGEDRVCTYEKATGSNMVKRNCTTAAERRERTAHDQEAMRKVQGSRAPSTQASPTGR